MKTILIALILAVSLSGCADVCFSPSCGSDPGSEYWAGTSQYVGHIQTQPRKH